MANSGKSVKAAKSKKSAKSAKTTKTAKTIKTTKSKKSLKTANNKEVVASAKTAEIIKQPRNYVIDLVRFVCAIGIVVYHFLFNYYVDPNGNRTNHRFRTAVILVEIFLIISGYFTAKHFATKKKSDVESRFKTSVKYTLKKFKAFMPVIALSLALGLLYAIVIRGFNFGAILREISKIPEELTLNSTFFNHFALKGHNPSLWYLSATFIVFPFFCVLASSVKKYLRNWTYLVLVIIYYSMLFSASYYGWDALFRVFIGLALGQLLYDFTEYLKTIKFSKKTKIALQLLELSCTALAFAILAARGDVMRPIENNPTCFNFLLASFTALALLLSGQTYTHKIKIKFFSTLGKISFPLFLLHYPILYFIHYFHPVSDYKVELVISLSLSIVTATIVTLVSDLIKKKLSSPIKTEAK